jgi:hypothetical protein
MNLVEGVVPLHIVLVWQLIFPSAVWHELLKKLFAVLSGKDVSAPMYLKPVFA